MWRLLSAVRVPQARLPLAAGPIMKKLRELLVPCCHTCKYVGNVNRPYLAEPIAGQMAWCYRHAPSLDKDGRTAWPQVYETTLCGDYEPNLDFAPTSGWRAE